MLTELSARKQKSITLEFVHAQLNLKNDTRYWGSGQTIRWLVAKHGTSHFTKEILEEFSTRRLAQAYEMDVVTLETLSDKRCLNLCLGGSIGCVGATWKRQPFTDDHRNKIRNALLGKRVPKEVVEKIRKANTGKKRTKAQLMRMKGNNKGNTVWRGRKHSPATIRLMSAIKMGHTVSKAARLKMSRSHTGKKLSVETRHRMSVSQTGRRHSQATRDLMSATRLRKIKSGEIK